jgi:hypothetical protein
VMTSGLLGYDAVLFGRTLYQAPNKKDAAVGCLVDLIIGNEENSEYFYRSVRCHIPGDCT